MIWVLKRIVFNDPKTYENNFSGGYYFYFGLGIIRIFDHFEINLQSVGDSIFTHYAIGTNIVLAGQYCFRTMLRMGLLCIMTLRNFR